MQFQERALAVAYNRLVSALCNSADVRSLKMDDSKYAYEQIGEILEKVKSTHVVFIYIALYLVASGMARIKAAVPSHGNDQFDEKDPREAKQMSRFFNCLLLALCVGGAVSLTPVVWLDDHKGWDVGFGVSTIAMILGLIVVILGLPWYHVVQGTSVILEIIQVFVAAVRNRNLRVPENPLELYEINKDKAAALEDHRDVYRFLDKAVIQTASDQNQTPNPLSSWLQVFASWSQLSGLKAEMKYGREIFPIHTLLKRSLIRTG